jgi:hypothetical protein
MSLDYQACIEKQFEQVNPDARVKEDDQKQLIMQINYR